MWGHGRYIYVTQIIMIKESNYDWTMKRVYTKVSDTSLSDNESMLCMQSSSNKSKVVIIIFYLSNCPRFLVISSSSEGALKISPFSI